VAQTHSRLVLVATTRYAAVQPIHSSLAEVPRPWRSAGVPHPWKPAVSPQGWDQPNQRLDPVAVALTAVAGICRDINHIRWVGV